MARHITCPKCKKKYALSPELTAAHLAKGVRCPACNAVIKQGASPEVPGNVPNPASTAALKTEVVDNFKKLYPMPHVVLKARRVLGDPYADFEALAKVIRADPALAGRVVKVANSAFYRRREQVASVQQAVANLGAQTVIQIITLVTQSKLLGKKLISYAMGSGDMWRHSLCTAVGCETISEKVKYAHHDETFLAGLMHDAAKIVLDPFIAARCPDFKAVLTACDSAAEAEAKTLGFDHAEIAAELCAKWQLSPVLIDGIRFHHNPAAVPDKPLARIVCLADQIALHLEKLAGDEKTAAVFDDVFLPLNLNATDIQKLAANILDRVETIEEDTF